MRAIVTGATNGIGLETAAALARAGYSVLMPARDAGRGEAAIAALRAREPGKTFETAALDLASLASVRAFAEGVVAGGQAIDVLVNNAGVMGFPTRRTTADGFELQFGTNHLGHFALTAWLLPMLMKAAAPRVVTVASLAHRRAKLDFDDLQSERSYTPQGTYGRTKLANLTFAIELDRRARAAGSKLLSVAVHPGLSQTNITSNYGEPGSFKLRAATAVMKLGGQSAAKGALPSVFAATSPNAVSGGYYGPDGFQEFWGDGVKPAAISAAAQDPAAGARLWMLSEQATGASYAALA